MEPGVTEDWDTLHERSAPHLHWATSNLGEAMPGVLTPLSWSVWRDVVEHAPREAARAIGGLTRAESRVPPDIDDRVIRIFHGRPAMQVEFLAELGDRMPGTDGPKTVVSILGTVPDGLTFSPSYARWPSVAWRLPTTFAGAPKRARALDGRTAPWWRASIERVPSLDLASAQALFLDAWARHDEAVTLQSVLILSTMQPLHDELASVVELAGTGDPAVLAGVGGAEMAVVSDLWATSRDRIGMEDVVARHGFHGPMEGELSSHVWREDPTPLERVVAQYRERPDSADPDVTHRLRRAELERMQAEVAAAVPAWQRPAVRRVLRLAAERLPLRGVPKRSFLQSFDVMRATARRMGDLLAADGTLTDRDDVFFLTREELTGTVPEGVGDLVRRRAQRRGVYQGLVLPSSWTGMPEPIPARESDLAAGAVGEVEELTGIGCSSGVVEGRVRVVTDPTFAEIEPDEVLVTATTDPSWSAIMFVSSALVVDIGGALSHAAVVARELGIPCVVDTKRGTSVLRTGDVVRVDGTEGRVTVLKRAEID